MQQVHFDPRQFAAGQQVQRNVRTQNALAELAPAAIQGNENALAQLAQFAPEMAMNIRNHADQRADRQQRMAMDQQRLDIAQQRLSAEQEAQARSIMEAQTAEQRKASLQALKAMQNGYAQGNRAIFETGLAALKRIDPETPDHVTFDNFAEMAPMLDGMVEIYATLEAPEPSGPEQEIARLMETGLDRNTAINIADGVWVVSRDPQTGEAQIIDKATGRPVAAQQALPEAQLAPRPELSFGEQPSLSYGEQFENADRAFGAGAVIRGAINTAGDTVGLGTAFPETQEAISDFRVFGEGLINAFASAYGRQPPSWLLRNIEALTPREGSLIEGPGGAQSKLRALLRELDTREQALSAQLSRPLRPQVKQDREGQILGIRATRQQIEQALQGFGGSAANPDDIDLMNRLLSDG